MKNRISKLLIIFCIALCFSSWMSSALAIFIGVLISFVFGNPWTHYTRRLSSLVLSMAVSGLGAGMNLHLVMAAGLQGFQYTFLSIIFTLFAGMLIAHFLKSDKESSILISFGTAICGGSAIAAISPVLGAGEAAISVALGVVFLLNSVALVVFPTIGNMLHLTQEQFGTWSALAIHDTSSVVGASMQYGAQALQIGTTIKLARALWIFPFVFLFYFYKRKDAKTNKLKMPYFIFAFLLFSAVFTYFPQFANVGQSVALISKKLMSVTLFLIGLNSSLELIKKVGAKPLIQGVLLWIGVSFISLLCILQMKV